MESGRSISEASDDVVETRLIASNDVVKTCDLANEPSLDSKGIKRRSISLDSDLETWSTQESIRSRHGLEREDTLVDPEHDEKTKDGFDFNFDSTTPVMINSLIDLDSETLKDTSNITIISSQHSTNTSTSTTSTSHISGSSKSKHTTRLKIWRLELLSLLLSVLSLIATITTLLLIQNRPLPRLPFASSINTLIAIYAATTQGCALFILSEGLSQLKWTWFRIPRRLHDFLVYDNASRGPWGAMQLLWYLWRSPGIAWLGAVLTVAVVVLDPVSQQLVWFDNGSGDLGGENATIAKTNVYNEHIVNVFNNLTGDGVTGDGQFEYDTRPSNDLIAAMAFGQFSDRSMQVPFTCQTGNCTFASEYSSVGYCGGCVDVSEFAVTIKDANGFCARTEVRMPNSRVLTLSNTASFQSMYDDESASPAVYMAWGDSSTEVNITTCTPSVYQCSLSPCIHTFRAKVENGHLIEEVVDRARVFGDDWVFGPVPEEYLSIADLDCVNTSTRNTLIDLGYKFNSTTRWLQYNVSWEPATIAGSDHYTPPLNLTPSTAGLDAGLYTRIKSNYTLSTKGLRVVPDQCLYQFGRSTTTFLESSAFSYYFNGSISPSSNGGVMGPPVAMDLRTTFQSLENATVTMQKIADAMTASMRINGSPNASVPAIGMVEHYAVMVRVRWEWISYMGVINLLLILFFGIMVFETTGKQGSSSVEEGSGHDGAKDELHDFKSNALATLFHGLDPYSLKILGELTNVQCAEKLEKESKKSRFVLVQSEHGWKLSLLDADGNR